MRGRFVQQRRNDEEESEEARFVVVKKIRDAILDETFKPGERLPEEQVGKMFNVSRSPVREALLAFENDRRFWDIVFEKAQRRILWEVFRQLDDRLTHYNPLVIKLFPDPGTRPRQQEVLIEFLRKGEVDEAVRAFKKLYLEVVHQIIHHLKTEDAG
jgi:DNA-binding GntR family transcriptional regulator